MYAIRSYYDKTPDGPKVFRLTDHMQRLYDSARIYRMPIPYEMPVLIDVCKEVVSANELTNGAYRITSYNVCYTKLLRHKKPM